MLAIVYGEREYYEKRSGLVPPEDYSLGDHQTAYWANELGMTLDDPQNQDDVELAFLMDQLEMTDGSVNTLNLIYWQQQAESVFDLDLPDGLSVDDYKAACLMADLEEE